MSGTPAKMARTTAPLVRPALIWGLIGLVGFSMVETGTAEARRRPHAVHVVQMVTHQPRHRVAPLASSVAGTKNPRFSAMVYDVKAGRTLYQVDPDGLRHPASLTKVMTLYLLFEQLQSGRMTMDTRLPVSRLAASQSPTKLGLRPGETIRVEDAMKGIITRSANDAAVVVAEAIGGTHERFCELMTRKARALGMTHTFYHNANGLPDAQQITTARDLVVLGLAIQDRFPKLYPYFSIQSFVYKGHEIGNHNHLLGSVEGVDGIKTGYTNASGFNLLTSVRRDGRQLVAVVMGGTSAGARDAIMRRLIADNMPNAAGGSRQAPMIADRAPTPAPAPVVAQATPPVAPVRARAAVVAEQRPTPPPQRPVMPMQLAVTPPPAPVKVVASAADDEVAPEPMPVIRPAVVKSALADTAEGGPVLRWVSGPAPVTTAAPSEPAPVAEASAPTGAEQADASDGTARTGWIIQVGATDSQDSAERLLQKAQSSGHNALASAEPFTEAVSRNGSKVWRARFSGFPGQRQAQAACAVLKSRDFNCMAVRL